MQASHEGIGIYKKLGFINFGEFKIYSNKHMIIELWTLFLLIYKKIYAFRIMVSKKIFIIDSIETSKNFLFYIINNLQFVAGIYEELERKYQKLQLYHYLWEDWSTPKLDRKDLHLYNNQAVNSAVECAYDNFARFPSNEKYIETYFSQKWLII